MNDSDTLVCSVVVRRIGRGARKTLALRDDSVTTKSQGRVPRIARFLALAIHFENLIRRGEVTSQSQLAELGHVSRTRITQIMNLGLLAPDVQEQILFFPRTRSGHAPIHLRQLQPIAAQPDWRKQRKLWKRARQQRAPWVTDGDFFNVGDPAP